MQQPNRVPDIQRIDWTALAPLMDVLPKLPAEILNGNSPTLKKRACLMDSAWLVNAGIWSATPFESIVRPYGVNEFMLLLEGSLSLISPDGSEIHVRAPDGVLIPKGLLCAWRQTEPVRKIYMTFAGQLNATPDVSSLRAVVLQGTSNSGLIDTSANGAIAERLLFVDESSRFRVGLRTSQVLAEQPYRAPLHELIHILCGSITFTDEAGVAHTFSAGNTVLLRDPKPMHYSCQSRAQWLFCAFDPVTES